MNWAAFDAFLAAMVTGLLCVLAFNIILLVLSVFVSAWAILTNRP